MRIAYRMWLEADGRAFGEGPAALLDLVRTDADREMKRLFSDHFGDWPQVEERGAGDSHGRQRRSRG